MKRRSTWIAIAAVTLLTLPAFQNCAGNTSSSESVSSKASSGNGAGYEGKTYVEVDQLGQCPAGVDVKSSLLVRDMDKRAFLTSENCAPLDPPKEVTAQLAPSVPHPLYDVQIWRGSNRSRVLDYLSARGNPNQTFEFSLLRCQKVISSVQSLSVAVVKNGMSPNFKGSAYHYMPGSNPQFKAVPGNNGNLSMTSGITLSYASTNPVWNITVDFITSLNPADPNHFTGTFTYQDTGGSTVTVTGLDCYL